MSFLAQKRVLLIASGGIAAYKAPLIVRALQAEGAEVRCVLTASAKQFVTATTLQALTHAPVGEDLFDPAFEAQIGHIELARWPDVILVAPATANFIARLAHGFANDLASTLLLATRAPILLAPAMNTAMWSHPATQQNLKVLESWGHTVIPPDRGSLACQEVGAGRQPDPPVLVDAVICSITPQLLAGKHVLITAGPTRAFLDPVRFLSNPSTGRMGLAMARAASWMGAEISLILGPISTSVPPLRLREQVDVETTPEMATATLQRLPSADWLIMTAAVGDWAPAESLTSKRKKKTDLKPGEEERWVLDLQRTEDILCEAVKRRDPSKTHIVGFAAETHDLELHATAKLHRKGCDAVLGNWVRSEHGDAFGNNQNSLLIVTHEAPPTPYKGSKQEVALKAWKFLIQHLMEH